MIDQEPVEMEFRDGRRWVPKHLAHLMRNLETYKMKYDDAVVAANDSMTQDFVADTMENVMIRHFRGR